MSTVVPVRSAVEIFCAQKSFESIAMMLSSYNTGVSASHLKRSLDLIKWTIKWPFAKGARTHSFSLSKPSGNLLRKGFYKQCRYREAPEPSSRSLDAIEHFYFVQHLRCKLSRLYNHDLISRDQQFALFPRSKPWSDSNMADNTLALRSEMLFG